MSDDEESAESKQNRKMKELVELQAEKEFLELQKKKGELFKRKEFQYGQTEILVVTNQEEVGGGKKKKNYNPMLGWAVQAGETYGSKEEDMGGEVVQRKEVKQKMVKNEKGLWVKAAAAEPEKNQKAESASEEEEEIPKGHWRCDKCKKNIINKRSRCPECLGVREDVEQSAKQKEEKEEAQKLKKLLKSAPKGEDPRLEAAAKTKSKDTNAAEKALEALRRRRTEEMREFKEQGEKLAKIMKKKEQPVVYAHPKFAAVGSAARRATGEKAFRGVSERATKEAGEGVLDFFQGTGAFAKKDDDRSRSPKALHEGHPEWQYQNTKHFQKSKDDLAADIEDELKQMDRSECIEVDFF